MSTQNTENKVTIKPVSKGWLLPLGLIFILASFFVISAPVVSTLAIELILGWGLAVGGVLFLFNALFSKSGRAFNLGLGIVLAGIGFWLLAFPLAGIKMLSLLIAIALFTKGILTIMFAGQFKGTPHAWVSLISGILSIAISIVFFSSTLTSAILIGTLIGVDLLFSGVSMLIRFFKS